MNRLNALLALALCLGVLLNAGSSAYSAWVASTNHKAGCARIGLLADEFENVISLALTPPKGKTYNSAQVAQVALFEARSSALLDRARC